MQETIELITNNGIGIVCVGWLIYFTNTTMKEIQTTLSKINESLITMSSRLDELENKVK